VIIVSTEKGSAQLKRTQGTLSILRTTESLPRAVGLENPVGVEDLGITGLVGGTKNGLTSNALGKRLSVTSIFTGRGAASLALKLFKWKFSTLALQTAHCMSFSPTIFSALNEGLFSRYPKGAEVESPPSKASGAKGMGAGF
jgi:hypothetical protein